MENNLSPTSFDVLFAEKCDIENNTEYTLSEYMPNISHIIRTEAKIKITEKEITPEKISISGEIVYTVLYVSENGGKLRCTVFKDEFIKDIFPKTDINAENMRTYISVKTTPISTLSRLSGQRSISSRSKFLLICEVIDLSDGTYCIDSSSPAECNTEYLRKDIRNAAVRIYDENYHNISENFETDADMPEISDIIDACGNVCIKNIVRSEGMCKVTAELTFNCLYEGKNGENSEYVSLERAIPFDVEIEAPDADSSWNAIADIKLRSLSVDSSSDNFGEQRVIEVSAGTDITLALMKNTDCTVIEDVYSTECYIVPEIKNVKTEMFEKTYNGTLDYSDRIHFELHPIIDIISSNLRLSFGNPEFSEGRVFVPARGTLSVLGLKENGEVDARTSQVNLRIPDNNIPTELFDRKLRWLNFTSVCRHECELSNGELLLHLFVAENCAAFSEDSINAVVGYEKNDAKEDCEKCSFTVYYPQSGESVWNVAKAHSVSCAKLRADNKIESDSFDGRKAVVLR